MARAGKRSVTRVSIRGRRAAQTPHCVLPNMTSTASLLSRSSSSLRITVCMEQVRPLARHAGNPPGWPEYWAREVFPAWSAHDNGSDQAAPGKPARRGRPDAVSTIQPARYGRQEAVGLSGADAL